MVAIGWQAYGAAQDRAAQAKEGLAGTIENMAKKVKEAAQGAEETAEKKKEETKGQEQPEGYLDAARRKVCELVSLVAYKVVTFRALALEVNTKMMK